MSMKMMIANISIRNIAIMAIACFGVLAHAETITVPKDAPTIQKAIDLAQGDDTILVEPSAGTKESSNLPELKHRIGVIKLPSFYVDFNDRRKNPNNYKSSSRDVKKHLQKFVDSNVDGLILDLRSNGGGGLDEAITMAGLFIGRNPVVVVRQSGGRRVTVHRSREKTIFENPVLLMLNRYSSTVAAILAGIILP